MALGPARRGLYGVMLALPTIVWAIGVDVAASFQIIADEELGIDARTLGIGLGLGVLSVPLQLWAARLPLWQARRNLQLFLVVTGLLAWALAALVALAPPASPWATGALVIAVTAEIVLSVFYATSWQPLLSYVLTSHERQRLASWWRAASTMLLALSLVAIGWADTAGRVGILVFLGAGAIGLAVLVRPVPVPPRPSPTGDRAPAPGDEAAPPPRPRLPGEFVALCVTAGIATSTAWPLFVTYAADVLWPTVNLGLLAATQLGGGIVAGLAWRTTVTGLVTRARRSAAGVLLAGGVVAAIDVPVTGGVAGGLTLAAAVTFSLSLTTMLMAMMELAHQVLDRDVTVRAFTIYDVVASTSAQVGLLIAGFLVAASTGSGWPVDPYRLYLVAGAVAVLATTCRRGWPGPRWTGRASSASDATPDRAPVTTT
jgi:hypothetical protein